MKVGVFSAIPSGLPLEQTLARIAGLGCDTVELGTGAYPGNAHCQPDTLLASEGKLQEFQAAVAAMVASVRPRRTRFIGRRSA